MENRCIAVVLFLLSVTAVILADSYRAPLSSGLPQRCLLPSETGPCRGAFPRFYYNQSSRSCEPFTYGGCGGNANNFETLAECQSSCFNRRDCLLDPESGMCLAYFVRYYFNRNTRTCQTFVYGGCGGNANNFDTQAECERRCARGRH